MKRMITLISFLLLIYCNGLNAQITILSPTDDTYADGGKATEIQNTTNPMQMWVKTNSSASFTRIGYIKFDITGITLANVGTAKLRLHCYQTDGVIDVSVFDADVAWSESTLTWNNKPTFIQPAVRNTRIVVGAYNEWSITQLVKDAIANGKTTISLALSDVSGSNKLARFYTKESTDPRKPQLNINTEKEGYQAFAPVADAMAIGDTNVDTNYGNDTGIQVKSETGNLALEKKGILKFDLNAIDVTKVATVGTARLRLYFSSSETNTPNAHISVLPFANNWDESTVTWNNFPQLLDASPIRTTLIEVDKLNKYYEWDISAYVIAKLQEAGSDKIISLGLLDLAGAKNGTTFNSKEAADFKPVIELLVEPTNMLPQNIPITGIYYVDALNGNDADTGLSTDHAWKTLAIVNQKIFGAGARILFKTGQSWTGSLKLKGSGTAGNPIVIASYGQDAKPIIHGAGALETILLDNNEYVEVRNLEITNYNPAEENGILMEAWQVKNTTDWFNNPTAGYDLTPNTNKVGVRVRAQDKGELHHIYLVNLVVHGINGDNENKDNGGIFMEIKGTLIPTFYNDFLVEGCHIYDVDRSGLSNVSTWDNRTLTDNGNWTPTLKYNVRNNIFERTGANALILRNAKDPIIEYNLFNQCAIKGSGNAAFNFNTDGAIFQYNESCWTKANIGDEDAGGLDSDFRTKNTILQYNYLHDNAYGMLATGGGFTDSFNDNTIFRYNIIERDGTEARENGEKFVFKLSGRITNTKYHNNVIYISKAQEGTDLMFHKQWSSKPANSEYYNNIYYIEGKNNKYNITSSTGTVISNNTFYAPLGLASPPDAQKLTTDPLFMAVGIGPNGYKLKNNSPAIASGKMITNNAPKDFFGNIIPPSGVTDRGIQQYSEPNTANPPVGNTKENFDIYLLIGQSNMAGRGEVESIDEVPLEKAYLFTDTENWENAAVPLNKYSTTRKELIHQKMGPGYTFARKLTEFTNKGIGLVVNARGGTSIEQWQKGYSGTEDFDLYEQAVIRLLAAKKDGTFKGIIWHQGESNQSSSSTYMSKLKKIVSDLRTDLGENVFFVAGEIGQWRDGTEPINNVIRSISNDINQASYVKSDDLKPINNDLTDPHFNGYSQRVLGGLYADEVLKNIYKISPGVASMYSKCDFKGYKVMLNSGIYSLLELQKRGIYDNDIRSLEIQAGYEVLLFTGQKQGSSAPISTSKNCLTDSSVNEDVSYVVIGKKGTTADMALSIEKKAGKFGDILVSPNPAKKNLKISFTSDMYISDIGKVKFVDVQGKSFNLKASETYKLNNDLEINFEHLNLNSGLYFLILETPSQIFRKKIIIEYIVVR